MRVHNCLIFFQNADNEMFWEQIVQETDPCKQQKVLPCCTAIVAQIKVEILAFKVQVIKSFFLQFTIL